MVNVTLEELLCKPQENQEIMKKKSFLFLKKCISDLVSLTTKGMFGRME